MFRMKLSMKKIRMAIHSTLVCHWRAAWETLGDEVGQFAEIIALVGHIFDEIDQPHQEGGTERRQCAEESLVHVGAAHRQRAERQRTVETEKAMQVEQAAIIVN